MTDEMLDHIERCAAALARAEQSASEKFPCYLQWLSCVSYFQKGKYAETARSAVDLLARCSLKNWFAALQLLLISLQWTEGESGQSTWGKRLIESAPLTPWQRTLVQLTLQEADIEKVLGAASDDAQACQASYYGAERMFREGCVTEARRLLQRSSEIESDCVERSLAENRLEVVAAGPGVTEAQPPLAVSITTSYRPAHKEEERQQLLRQDSGGALLAAASRLLAGEPPGLIALRVDHHRTKCWEQFLKYREKQIAPGLGGFHDPDFQWLPRKGRYCLADAYKQEFLQRLDMVNLLQDHPSVEDVPLIGGDELLRCGRIPEYREIKTRLRPHRDVRRSGRVIFLSHRWMTYEHPDPDGIQFRILAPHILPDASYWIDYSCLPQRPRTKEEEAAFRASLSWIPSFFFNMEFLVLRYPEDGYSQRAWCFVELLAATVLGRTVSFIGEVGRADGEGRKVLEDTLVDMDMPSVLSSSDPADLEAIRNIVQNLVLFFNLRVAERYMGLGQDLTDGQLFFAEDPYYLLAVCDFSDVILWLFDKAKQHGLRLVDLCQDTGEYDWLQQLARLEDFGKEPCPEAIPKKVALDESRLTWFARNHSRTDSPARLFFKITSLIK